MCWARKIKELRFLEDLKQDALAKQLGVSQASVSQWERGVTEPPETIRAYIDARLRDSPLERFLESLRTSVRNSPNLFVLLRYQDSGVVIDLISEGTRNNGQLVKVDDVGESVRGRFGSEVDQYASELLKAGLFEGRLASAKMQVIAERDGKALPVVIGFTPFHGPDGVCILQAEIIIAEGEAAGQGEPFEPGVSFVPSRLEES